MTTRYYAAFLYKMVLKTLKMLCIAVHSVVLDIQPNLENAVTGSIPLT